MTCKECLHVEACLNILTKAFPDIEQTVIDKVSSRDGGCKHFEDKGIINRQKEKIEELKNDLAISKKETRRCITRCKAVRAEASKEFAERLEKKIFPYGMPDNGNYGINAKAIKLTLERTAKEMVGESNGNP